MNQSIRRIAITALTLGLLALPLAAAAIDQTDSHRIKFIEENLWDHEEVEQIAHYEIFVDRETDVRKQMRFLEMNVSDFGTDYVIDLVYPAQPVGEPDLTKPEGISERDWIRFVEDNQWDVNPNADFADLLPPFQDERRTDPPMPADENDKLTAYTALCQGEGLKIPLERAFSSYADDVRDYCRNTGLASYAGAQGEGHVEPVNQRLNPY